MRKPFRFGVQLSSLSPKGWQEEVRGLEALGYSSILMPDHFGSQWDPVAALGAIAAATHELRVGALVYDVDFRHPAVFAKASATLHLLSGGRHEFGIGAGWMRTDYDQTGIACDPPGVRVRRLDEALQIIKSMWSQESTSFEGEHYRVQEIARAAPLPEGERPWILVGGGRPKILGLAGRHADIVGINPSLEEGQVTNKTAADLAPDRIQQKIDWVRAGAEAAGRSFDEIELNSLVFVVALTDDPKPIREGLAGNTGMNVEQVADCPLFLTGPGSEIRERLEKRREQSGISYVVIQRREPELMERFAEEVVVPLTGK